MAPGGGGGAHLRSGSRPGRRGRRGEFKAWAHPSPARYLLEIADGEEVNASPSGSRSARGGDAARTRQIL
jgi:hypothetical protein